jgi:formamidopyrimidine-DNA glycosylase
MPELPDIIVYLDALGARVVGQRLQRVRIASPFLLRSVEPPLHAAEGRVIAGLRRLGKRVVFDCGEALFLVVHLMIAGRFRWGPPAAKIPGKIGLAAFDLTNGTLVLTEQGTRKRASLHVVRGETALAAMNPGGIEVLTAGLAAFADTLRRESHTLKRALTDPRLFGGIGNAYSDEILHEARLSPLALTRRLEDEQVERLFRATRTVLETWIARLRRETAGGFPDKVTAFRPEMAVHGRFGQPCPTCRAPVQRLVYAGNECNYCVGCQTGGRLLADRALSRLLREDWPRTLEELEEHKTRRRSDN